MGIGLPTVKELEQGFKFVARRLRWNGQCNMVALQAALRYANDHLERSEYEGDAPAALFYALARHPRCFPRFRAMTFIIIRAFTARYKVHLACAADEFGALCMDVVENRISFEDVCAWFEERLEPLTVREGMGLVKKSVSKSEIDPGLA